MTENEKSYPPEFTDERGLALASNIIDYQLNHGSLLKHIDLAAPFPEGPTTCSPVGVTVFPTLFPREQFERAHELQPIYNELYCAVAEDEEWIFDTIQPLLPIDPLAAALWEIYTQVKQMGHAQDISAGIFRSDYMIQGPGVDFPVSHTGCNVSLKQVEFNTFSCAGGTHASKAGDMHRYLARTGAYRSDGNVSVSYEALPRNPILPSLAACLGDAHEAYGPKRSDQASEKGVLFVVQPNNFNVADERPIEYALWDLDTPVPACRAEFPSDILDYTTLTESRELLFHPPWLPKTIEVSVVYMRAGYEVHEYDAAGKEARLRLELSAAVKCPSLLGHICTFKKVQCALIASGALERFVSPVEAEMLRSTFMAMYPLDESELGMHARRLATDPVLARDYILKPSLEGGGHNVFGDDIPDFLASTPEEKWAAYILMQRIVPPSAANVLLSPRGLDSGPVVSELGVFGTCLWKRGRVLRNSVAGWSFKTKDEEVNEMSVVKGYGCFDTPLLF
ncbi:hypothetical protein BDV25DRAFT_151689 [Aspergillus avenaceus]|uniref:Glutathione synthetase n=1 Tax=Aspergillus avenaceus TaxID=36643 RepID=A0A5N6U0A8_ASPAV|nr:hypothetical protein BDV25DRAFT_151689 [Aspergillus avenaceus]